MQVKTLLEDLGFCIELLDSLLVRNHSGAIRNNTPRVQCLGTDSTAELGIGTAPYSLTQP